VLRAYRDGTIFGELYGEGPVRVLWLHGWQRRGADFAGAAQALARAGVGSLALDLPGFGSSPLPTVAGGAREYASALAPVLREVAAEPLILVGHSFGGSIATVLAAEHPELVRAVVLSGAPLLRERSTTGPPWRYRAIRWLRARSLVSEERLEAARQRYGSRDYRHAEGRLRDVLVATVNESYEDEISRLRVPVVMVWGEHDTEAPLGVAERAATQMTCPHSMRVVAGVGHMVPLDAPGELVAAVQGLLG